MLALPGLLWVLAAALPAAPPEQGSGVPGPTLLELGVKQYRDGDYEAAVFSLDSALRKLTDAKDVTRGNIHLGACYVALHNERAARGKFRAALRLTPTLTLSDQEFGRRVIEVFDSERLVMNVARKKRKGRFVALGAVAAAGGAVALSAGSSGPPANAPPSASIGVTPNGNMVVGITTATLEASAADADGDALSYSWQFGDGGSAQGARVDHVFQREGTFDVSLTVSDGHGHDVQAHRGIVVANLSGLWCDRTCGPDNGVYSCQQSGTTFTCVANTAFGALLSLRGQIRNPRTLLLQLERRPNDFSLPPGLTSCQGEAEPTLLLIRCPEYYMTRQGP